MVSRMFSEYTILLDMLYLLVLGLLNLLCLPLWFGFTIHGQVRAHSPIQLIRKYYWEIGSLFQAGGKAMDDLAH